MTFFKVKYKHHFKWSICFQLHAIDIIITAAGWNAGCMSEQQSQWYKLYYINIILLIYGRDKDISFVWSAPIKCRTDWYQVDRSVRCSTTDFLILFAAINPAIHRKNLNTKFSHGIQHFSKIYNVYHEKRAYIKNVRWKIIGMDIRCISIRWANWLIIWITYVYIPCICM